MKECMAARDGGVKLRPFQTAFVRKVVDPTVSTAVLSLPRANGKSWLAGYLLTRCLTPGDKLHQAGAEYLLCAASLEQSRVVFRFVRSELEATGAYRFIDSVTRLGITHVESNTKLRVLSSNAKTAMGIVGCPLLVADEPGSWETVGGQLMHDAIQTAQGKPGSPLKVVYIGTLAPALSGWWHDLVERGTSGGYHVKALRGIPEQWDSWAEIKRVNPLSSMSPELRAQLKAELQEAKRDTRLKARFLSYRLNIPSADESSVLLTVEDWQRVIGRPVPERQGRPIVGVDLGAGRAFSTAVAIYPSGRCEAIALAPGIPDMATQERRDLVKAGTYQRLVNSGRLEVAEDYRVPPVKMLVDRVLSEWGRPRVVVADRFRVAELRDANKQLPIEERVTRWSEAAADIRALRKMALDGPLAVDTESRDLIAASLSVAMVKNDDQGNVRLLKHGTNNNARDDVAAALVLGAGAQQRILARPARSFYIGTAG